MHILLNRLHVYPITKEIINLNNILHSNQYKDIQVNKTPKKPSLQKQNTQQNLRNKEITKWATFTYNEKEVKKLQKYFKMLT
jgi:hypothetical protein